MDFLGLRTLSTLTRSVDLELATREARGEQALKLPHPKPPVPHDEKGRIDIEKIDLTDQNVFELFRRGDSKGVFQFESGGMQDLLMKMRPDRIEDLIAANALYRPGPMELIPTYCNRKHGVEPVPKVHPIMDAILAETYGIMVYQEQVMQIFNGLGGIELANAYKLIKAISKKTTDVIAKFHPDFIKGTMEKGVSKEKAEEIFELILKFGGYGFNKSHSSRYAIVAYQTAYMKVYHPPEYMAALLTFEMGSTEKVVEYIEECKRMPLPDGRSGVRVLPPDVNISDKDFTPVYADVESGKGKRKIVTREGSIRFGLMAVRGVGEKPVENIIAERQRKGDFTSLYDFCERVDLRQVTKSTTEALVKCGAFSSLGAKRAQLLQVLDKAVEMAQQAQQDKRAGQMNFFGSSSESTTSSIASTMGSALPAVEELPDADLLKFEKELLGFYITSHPLTEHQSALEHFGTVSSKEAKDCYEGAEVVVGGMISRVKKVITKNGRSAGMPMGIITLEDLDGSIDGTMFAETFAEVTQKFPDVVSVESICFVKGKVDKKRETPSLLINEIIPVSDAAARLTTAVAIKLDPIRHSTEVVSQLEEAMKRHKGGIEVFLQVQTGPESKVTMRLNKERFVKPTRDLVDDLDTLLGPGSCQLCGAGTKRRKKQQQQQLFREESAGDATGGGLQAASIEPTGFDDSAELEMEEA